MLYHNYETPTCKCLLMHVYIYHNYETPTCKCVLMHVYIPTQDRHNREERNIRLHILLTQELRSETACSVASNFEPHQRLLNTAASAKSEGQMGEMHNSGKQTPRFYVHQTSHEAETGTTLTICQWAVFLVLAMPA